MDTAIVHLLDNTENKGTVVRWSAALALGEILKFQTQHNTALLSALESVSDNQEQHSIKKIYQAAFKKVGLKKKQSYPLSIFGVLDVRLNVKCIKYEVISV